jgi:hypothetical protein
MWESIHMLSSKIIANYDTKLCLFFCCRFVLIWTLEGIGTTTNNVEDDGFFGVDYII